MALAAAMVVFPICLPLHTTMRLFWSRRNSVWNGSGLNVPSGRRSRSVANNAPSCLRFCSSCGFVRSCLRAFGCFWSCSATVAAYSRFVASLVMKASIF